ncbi:MAG: hypothetical protein AAFX93_05320 [Verrucomicrobiota bacterium]
MMIPRPVFIGIMIFMAMLGSFQLLSNDALAIAVFLLAFYQFYHAIEEYIPIVEITGVIASLQWLVGPVIGYNYGTIAERYEMYVPANEYFAFALPATCLFLAGLSTFNLRWNDRAFLSSIREPMFFQIGIMLFVISLVAQFLQYRVGGSLAFLFFLLAQLRYVAALYFLFSGHHYRWIMFAICVGTLFVRSAESAMFHDLIIWMALLGCFWYQTTRIRSGQKILLFLTGLLGVFIIQLAKTDYREEVWSGRESASLVQTVYDKIVNDQAFADKDALQAAGQRINQGWIISAVMLNVPRVEPYAEGETIKNAFIGAVFPRAVLKNKAMAGGQETFVRFTGLNLEKGTSMGISIIGEGYANFGGFGGSIFMFAWGAVYSGIYCLIRKKVTVSPSFVFWVPLIFYQAIKAETELLVVLNQLTKGSIVAFGVFFAINQIAGGDVLSKGGTNDQNSRLGLSSDTQNMIQILVLTLLIAGLIFGSE